MSLLSRIALCTSLLFAALWQSNLPAEDELVRRGEAIYKESCADCHGGVGEGVAGAYEDALIGDSTIGELTKVIADTMPEEDPDACVDEEAAAVASYIHHAFYSEAARVRNRPPRADIARLTAEQLRQSLADLYGHFENDGWREDRRGIQGTYFDGARWKKDKIRIERIDPVLQFDFGKEGPGEGINPQDFYILWEGSLRATHSGRYEIVLRSSCSCKLYFGSHDRILVNNHVQSEGKTEFRRTLHLTAGRDYPLKLEFSQRKRKTEQPPANVSLSWVAPGGVEEIIPRDHLIPSMMPAQFPLQAKLPPDDRSYGYERGIAINSQWDESTTAAALEFAQIAVDEMWPQYRRRHRKDSDENRGRLRSFLSELVETAQRGPLDDVSRKLYIDAQLDATEDDAEAIKRVALITLKSPRFLYPALDRDRKPSQINANRLALVLHDSLPADRWLVTKIEKDQLETDKQISEAAWRMVEDPRCQQKTRAFLYQWFDLHDLNQISKDQEIFPGFDAALVNDLQRSFDAFLNDVLSSESCDYRQLLQADWAFTNARLEQFYGESWKASDDKTGEELTRSVSDSKTRAGLLTHPLLMSRLAHHKSTSPIHRGVFLYRHILGRTLRPPNAAFAPLDPNLHPGLTTRERVEMQTGDVDCQVCHQKINSLGFVLENYDGSGRYRSSDNGKPVDASGSYIDRVGNDVGFGGARDLADYLAASDDCHSAFVEAAFEHFVKQPPAAYGPETGDRLTLGFVESGFHVRKLIVSIAEVVARYQPEPQKT